MAHRVSILVLLALCIAPAAAPKVARASAGLATYTDSASGYAFSYPASWKLSRNDRSGRGAHISQVQVSSPDQNMAFLAIRATGTNPSGDLRLIDALISRYGTMIDKNGKPTQPSVNLIRINGMQFTSFATYVMKPMNDYVSVVGVFTAVRHARFYLFADVVVRWATAKSAPFNALLGIMHSVVVS